MQKPRSAGLFAFWLVLAALQSKSMFRRLIAILSLFAFLIAGASAWGHGIESGVALQCSQVQSDEQAPCAEGVDTAFNGEQQDGMEGWVLLGFYPRPVVLIQQPLAPYLAPRLPYPYPDALQRPPCVSR